MIGFISQLISSLGIAIELSSETTATVLKREGDGTITVVSIATPPTPTITRQPDGTVNTSGF